MQQWADLGEGGGGLCWETCFRENGLNKPVLCIGVLRCPLQTLRPPFSPVRAGHGW